jgi:DNA primase
MDVVALAQFGIANAVATLGTATTSEHLEKLFRATPEVVFCFDGDRAGRDAAWKALNVALPLLREGRQAAFLFLPDGEDPDTLVRKVGADGMRARVGQAQPLSEVLFEKLASQVDMATIDGRARFGELALPLIKRLPEGMFRDMMLQNMNDRVGLATPGKPVPRPSIQAAGNRPQGRITPMRRAVALLVQHPELGTLQISRDWQGADLPGADLLAELLQVTAHQPGLATAALVERWEDPAVRAQLAKLAVLDLGEIDDAQEQFLGSIQALNQEQRRRAREALLEKSRSQPLSEEEKQRLRELYRPFEAQ